jgi:ABC-2 type transport system ATP-binding protein
MQGLSDYRLEARELHFGYKRRPVLKGVSFELGKGEIVGLLGANGAGKSTLFRLLSGLFPLQQGVISFNGMPVAKASSCVHESMRAKMGVVFQECSLDAKLSARANLMLSGSIYGVEKQTLKQKISEGLADAGLTPFANDAVKTFSGGMKRKLELLRARLHDPQLLLMDEPSAGLDEEAFSRFWNFLNISKYRRDLTALLATHRLDEADKCDRLIILHEGSIVASDSPAKLKSQVLGDRVLLRFNREVETHKRKEWHALLQRSFATIELTLAPEEIKVVAQDGYQLVPRLVELLPPAAFESVHVRKPTLADAFLQITGARL